MENATVACYYSYEVEDYLKRGTVTLAFDERVNTGSLRQIITERLGWMEAPKDTKSVLVASSGYITPSIVVTNQPNDIYALIQPSQLDRWFKARDVLEAATNLGLQVNSLREVHEAEPAIRSRIFGPLIAMKCQKERVSETQLLGCERLSWDTFGERYYTIQEHNQILVFPRTKVPAHDLYHSPVRFNQLGYSAAWGRVTYDDTGDYPQVWICMATPSSGTIFDATSASDFSTVPADAWSRISDIFDRRFGTKRDSIGVIATTSSWRSAFLPRVLAKAETVFNWQWKDYTVEQLKALARELGVKGYSDKTKAETTIMLAEAISALEPPIKEPALIYDQSNYYTAMRQRIGQSNMITKLNEIMSLAMHVISDQVYVPTTPAQATRIGTNASFNSRVGVKPIDIFGELLHANHS